MHPGSVVTTIVVSTGLWRSSVEITLAPKRQAVTPGPSLGDKTRLRERFRALRDDCRSNSQIEQLALSRAICGCRQSTVFLTLPSGQARRCCCIKGVMRLTVHVAQTLRWGNVLSGRLFSAFCFPQHCSPRSRLWADLARQVKLACRNPDRLGGHGLTPLWAAEATWAGRDCEPHVPAKPYPLHAREPISHITCTATLPLLYPLICFVCTTLEPQKPVSQLL